MSLVQQNVTFLRHLGNQTRRSIRLQLIQQMDNNYMEAFAKVVEGILYGLYPILRRDHREFRHHVDALRQITSRFVSLRRKKRTLERIHHLIPRLLRERYLRRTIRMERQQNVYGHES